jgi:putative Holliday junction resolvase
VAATSPDATVLAFDFGTRRIGVAVGNTLTRAAHPLATIDDERTEQRFAAIGALLAEWGPGTLVVGLPTHADGSKHEMSARARRFARQLEGRFHLPVAMVDERWTTQDAQAALDAAGTTGRKARAVRDSVAAQLILQGWFDQPDEPNAGNPNAGDPNAAADS